MDITAEQWAEVSVLLDEALELPPESREHWLLSLGAEHIAVVPVLRRFLEQAARFSNTQFLATLPGGMSVPGEGEQSPKDELAAGGEVGPYRLIRPLGSGGMGTVWLAERSDGLLARQVALKLPHLMGERRALTQRFERERQILSALAHPNIARLYDAGVSAEGRPYLALEYVQGQTLMAYCDAQRLGLRERVHMFLQVLEAVRFAHANLVVHRDLKPSNLLVNGEGQVQLLDFGIAKLLDDDLASARATALTQLGGVAMTPQYAAPEQILGRPVGTACDVYSLGVMLYELLTGVLPYRLRHDTRALLEEAIAIAEPARPSAAVGDLAHAAARGTSARRLARQLRGDLDTIVLKALKKEPVQRFLSVESFAKDLHNWLDGAAVLAQPDSRWYRTRKFLVRNWLPVAAGSVVVVALSAGLGVALWQAQRAQLKEQVARKEVAKSKAVLDFLDDLFTSNSNNQADPVKARARTARELLDEGAAKIDTALADAPQARLEVYAKLSDMYGQLGLNDRGLDLARKRVELANSIFGPNDLETVSALVHLGNAGSVNGALEEGEKALKRAEATLDAMGDVQSVTRAQLEHAFAALYALSDETRSFDHANRAVALLEAYLPEERPMMAESLILQVVGRSRRGDQSGALQAALRGIDLAEHGDAPLRDYLPTLYGGAGLAQFRMGRYGEAEVQYRRAYEASRAINAPGQSTPEDVAMGSNLAVLHRRLSYLRESVEALERLQAEALRQVRHGDRSGNAPSIALQHTLVALDYGQPEVAAANLRIAQGLLEQGEVALDVQVLAQQARAGLALVSGDHLTALARLDRARQLAVQMGSTGRSLNDLSELDVRTRLAAGRLELAQTALQGYTLVAEPPGSLTLNVLIGGVLRAEVLLASRQPAQALQLASDLSARIRSSGQPRVFALHAFRLAMVEGAAAMRLADPPRGQDAYGRAQALAQAVFDPRSPDLADAQVGLASSEIALGHKEAAAALLASARRILGAHPGYAQPIGVRLRKLEAQCACAQ